ncbi:hypothetical protein NQZ68_028794 [Dissostichus eleginoides]|nr:hypothetical protein NQZ68_028794 [Dissostichus eleginoides]
MVFLFQEVGNRYGNFSLATMFPRREFTSEDLNKTFLELELTPSASIVLLPLLGDSSAPSCLQLRPSRSSTERPRPQPSSYSAAAAASDRETLPNHTAEKRPKDFRKDGKICRLRNQEDSEDENNTWNGNSTQQM